MFISKCIQIWRIFQKPENSIHASKKLVIIGGGFAGAYAAKKLEDYFDLTLIDTKDYFEFTPSVLRTIVEPNHISRIQIPHTSYLNLKRTRIIRHKALQITADNNVTLDSGESVSFDYLFLACGSSYNVPFKESNVVLASRGSTLSASYKQLLTSNRVLIIGGGLVGVELAAEIVEHFPFKKVTLVHAGPHLLSRTDVPVRAVNNIQQFLVQQGVEVVLGERVLVNPGPLFTTDQKRAIYADMAFICTGIKSNSDLLRSNHANCLDSDGYAITNEYLQLQGNPHIFVAGDVSNIKEEKLAQSAEVAASTVVHNLLAYSKGQDDAALRKYVPTRRIKLISLGKYNAVLTYKNISFMGFIPALMKEFVEWKVMTAYKYRSGKIFGA